MGLKIIHSEANGLFDPYSLPWDSTISFPSTRSLIEYGNKVYNRYPARSIFLVPRATIMRARTLKSKDLNVLDPFMGSGTTAVEASLLDSNIFGVEMDPFARLISEVSIMRFSSDELTKLEATFKDISTNWRKSSINHELYPDLKNVDYWFDENTFEDLLRLKTHIYLNVSDEKMLKYFQVVFADCIKPCSKMERQSTKPYISSKYEKKIKSVDDSIRYSFKKHLNASKQYSTAKHTDPSITWLGLNATDFRSPGEIIDIAITSPPYINAFDYTQVIKVESAWVGTLSNQTINALREVQVGHERRRFSSANKSVKDIFEPVYSQIINSVAPVSDTIKAKSADTCLAYFNDIYTNLTLVWKSLSHRGEYHIVVGDGNIRGVEVRTHSILAELAKNVGYEWFGYYRYPIRDHRTSIPRNGMGGKIKYEYVLMLRKK
jgi:hypothetical protein